MSKEQQSKASAATIEESFKGYTIEEIRFQRALLAMQAEFCKDKFMKTLGNIQNSLNPFSPSSSSMKSKTGAIALKLLNGLNYIDYIMIGWSVFSGARKIFSFFKGGKKK